MSKITLSCAYEIRPVEKPMLFECNYHMNVGFNNFSGRKVVALFKKMHSNSEVIIEIYLREV